MNEGKKKRNKERKKEGKGDRDRERKREKGGRWGGGKEDEKIVHRYIMIVRVEITAIVVIFFIV